MKTQKSSDGIVSRLAVICSGPALLIYSVFQPAWAGGVYINDGIDNSCYSIIDGGTVGLITSNPGACAPNVATQTTQTNFFGPAGTSTNNNPASSSLSLGGRLYVNAGQVNTVDQTNFASRIGNNTTTNAAIGANSLAIGTGAGSTTTSTGTNSISIGAAAAGMITASGASSIAIGGGAISSTAASAANTIAIGTAAISSLANSIALGNNSVASAVSDTTNNTTANSMIGGRTLIVTQAPTNGVLALGNRQIQAVADGALSATSTDAVNGAQLFNVATALDSKTDSLATATAVALGGSAAYNTTTGTWTAPSFTVQSADYSNVGAAIVAVDSSLTNLSTSINNGSAGVVKRGTDAGTLLLTAANGTAAAPGNAQTLRNLAAGGLSATSTDAVNGAQLFTTNSNVTNLVSTVKNITNGTNGPVRYDSASNSLQVGATLGGTYVNFAGNGSTTRRLSGVSNGTDNNDAVTISQIKQLIAGLGGNGVGVDATGAVVAPQFIVAGNALSLADSIAQLDSRTPQSQQNGVLYDASGSSVTLGKNGDTSSKVKLMNVAEGELSATSTDAVNGSQLKNVADQVANNTSSISQLTMTVNNSIADSTVRQNSPEGPITIGAKKKGDTIAISGIDGNRVLTGLKDGIKASDAATVGQLQAAAGNISSRDDNGLGIASAPGKNGLAVGAGAKASGEESNSFGAGSVASGSNSIAYGTKASATAKNTTAVGHKSTASGTNATAFGQGSQALGGNSLAMGGDSIASGNNSVSLGQGSVASRDNTVSIGSTGHERQISNVAAGTADTDAANVGQVNQAFQSLSNSVNKVNRRISDLDNKLTGGIASSMAMAGIPQAYQPDSSLVGASAATYKGKSAIAIGVSRISENGKWILKATGSGNTANDFGASVGVGYQW